jgi:hypothetical protein
MYTANLINRLEQFDTVNYDCVMTDDEGIMPDRREQISIPADKATERYIRSIKNLRCAYHEEQYFSTLPVENEPMETRAEIIQSDVPSMETMMVPQQVIETPIDENMMSMMMPTAENTITTPSMDMSSIMLSPTE